MHAPVHMHKRVLTPRQRLGYGLSIGMGIAMVLVGWVTMMKQEIGGTLAAARDELRGARETTGAVLEESGTPEALETIRSEVVNTFRPTLQGLVQGQQALETVSGIMKEKLYAR